MVISSLGSETSGVLIIDCMICGDPTKLSNVLEVTEPDNMVLCSPLLSEEFLPDCRPALVGYRLLNGNLVFPVCLMMI